MARCHRSLILSLRSTRLLNFGKRFAIVAILLILGAPLRGFAQTSAPLPASVTATAGTPQSTALNNSFPTALAATVKDSSDNPVSGITVTFAAPTSGPSATFTGGLTTTSSTTDGSGVATAPTFTANGPAGSYTRSGRVSRVFGPANVNLTNVSVPPGCSLSSASWQSQSFPMQTGSFTASFEATPSAANNNGVIGLSSGIAAAYTDLAAIVRFNTFGFMDAVNGTAYTADTAVSYTADTSYHFRLVVNIPNHTYSVFVAPQAGSEIPIATNYAFQSTQATATSLSYLSSFSDVASTIICNLMAPAFDFVLSSSGNVSVIQGSSVTNTVKATLTSGTTQAVSLSVSELPTGVTSSFSPISCNPTCTSTVTLNTASSTPAGSYTITVTATAGNLTRFTSFTLRVTGPPASITATAGTPQSPGGITSFPTALAAIVKDSSNNPVSGVTVTFAAPASGASGSFTGRGLTTTSSTTNSSGIATAPTFTANRTAGSYTVTATVSGVSAPANFNLTNSPGRPEQSLCSNGNGTAGDNTTTVGTLDLKAAMQGIAYQACYSGDANTNNTVTVQYRQTGTGTWLNAYIVINGTLINPFNDRRAIINGVSNAYYQQFRGSIVGLQPGTSYDVQVTFSDPDGVVGGPTLTGTISTATTTPPHTGTTITVTDDTSFNNALTTVTAAQTIHVNAGNYTGTKTLTVSGNSGNYIVVDCDHAGGAHISGGSPTIQINANYVVVQYCDLPSSAATGISIGTGQHDIYIQNNTMDSVNSGCNEASGIDLRFASSNIWILNNTIHQGFGDCQPGTVDGADIASGQGINIEDGGSATGAPGLTSVTIQGNTITGFFDDGITQNSANGSPHIENIEVTGNTVQDYKDDGIEFKLMSINNRAIGNTVIGNNATTCFAANSNLQNGQSYGPVYFARNNCHMSSSTAGAEWKIGNSDSVNEALPVLAFHNSVYENTPSHSIDHFDCEGGAKETIYFINNIYYGQGNYIHGCNPYGEPGTQLGNSLWDYNDVFTCCNDYGFRLNNFADGNPSSFANWQAEGSNEDPHSFSSSAFPYVSATDLHLVAASVAIDQGVVLNNFNDANSAWPYSGTAPDVGAFEFASGPTTGNSANSVTATAGTPQSTGPNTSSPNVSLSVPENQCAEWFWTGNTSSATAGYATLQMSKAHAGSGIAMVSEQLNGVVVSETGVPASSSMLSGRTYVNLKPPASTGISFANSGDQDAVISFYFTDAAGTDFGRGSFTLAAHSQISALLDKPPFNGPSSAEGTFTFSSSVPVGAVTVQGLINPRGEFLYTTFPFAPVNGSSSDPVIIPDFADGGGWTTQVILINPPDSPITGTVEFYSQGTNSQNGQLDGTGDWAV